MGFRFQSPARPDAVQVSVDIELEQIAGIIAWTPRRLGSHTLEACRLQIEIIDEGIDKPDHIVRPDIIIDAGRKQEHLGAR